MCVCLSCGTCNIVDNFIVLFFCKTLIQFVPINRSNWSAVENVADGQKVCDFIRNTSVTQWPRVEWDLLHFQARGSTRQSNLGFLCCSIFVSWMNVCLHSVRFSFFSSKPGDWLGQTCPKWPSLHQVGHKTSSQSQWHYVCVGRFCANLNLWFTAWCRKNEPLVIASQKRCCCTPDVTLPW